MRQPLFFSKYLNSLAKLSWVKTHFVLPLISENLKKQISETEDLGSQKSRCTLYQDIESSRTICLIDRRIVLLLSRYNFAWRNRHVFLCSLNSSKLHRSYLATPSFSSLHIFLSHHICRITRIIFLIIGSPCVFIGRISPLTMKQGDCIAGYLQKIWSNGPDCPDQKRIHTNRTGRTSSYDRSHSVENRARADKSWS